MVELSFSAISERDIDLLVLEALATCDGFARWFLARVGFDTDARLVKVAHSVGTASGETDIELTIEMHRAVHRILVENKLDAAFQPRQPERYAERAAAYIRDGLCAGVTTVLLAPQEYLNGCREHVSFDHYVPLEDVRDEIRVHEPGSPRSTYKQILLDKALDRARTGWVAVPDPAASAYWSQYWELASRIAPELAMRQPGPKPAGSTWIYFHPPDLPPSVEFFHKIVDGHVQLQFSGTGARFNEMRATYASRLEEGMTIEPTGKSVAIRIAVPPSSFAAPFAGQEPIAEKALDSAARLLKWYLAQVAPST